jgi:anti-sigma B factor antagonist
MSDSLFETSKLDQGVTQVRLTGEVDAGIARQLQVALEELVREGHNRLLVDLSDVSFIDSTGLGVFLFMVKRLRRRRGRLAVYCPNPVMRELFELVGHNLIFPVDETLDAAHAHLRPRRRFGAPGAGSRSPASGHSAGR